MDGNIKILDVSILRENKENPRVVNKDKFDRLKRSITEFPEMLNIRPIVVDSDMVVLGGNMRLKALLELGIEKTAVIVAENLTEDQRKEFIIKDNVGFGDWDTEILANDWDQDQLIDWGLDLDFPIEEPEATEDDFEIPDDVHTNIVLGDLIEIGEHRLMCGDSTDSDSVSKLMGGVLADIVVTDPPYNTGMISHKDKKARLSHMFNDSFTDQEWIDFLSAVFNNYDLFTKGECAFYVFIDWRRVSDIKGAVESICSVKNVIVWDKQVHGLGSDYKSTYENCVVGKKGKPEINNRHGLDYQDIWRVQRNMGRVKEHATQKPIELLKKPIIHASKEDDIVLDFFLGSGSTMVASEQLSRRCYGMELEPNYCQVIIDRMLNLDPSLEVKINGELIK